MGNNKDTGILHPTFQYQRAQLHQQLAVAQLLTKPNLLYQEPFDCLVTKVIIMTSHLEPCEISTVKSSFPDNLSALCSYNFYFVSFRMFLKQVKIVISQHNSPVLQILNLEYIHCQ